MLIQYPQVKLRPDSDTSELKDAICAAVVSVCSRAFGNQLRGIVLTGSMARGEATFVSNSGHWSVLGDAEFFIVFQEQYPLPQGARTESVRQLAERALMDEDLRCHIDLSPVHPKYLTRLPPHILAYELKQCGQVVWGDPQLLSLIPPISPSDIPLEDAWRLLSNRMVEYLAVAADLSASPATLSPAVFYRTVKLYLDMATSYLLFSGSYEPTYAARTTRLRAIVTKPSGIAPPFPLLDFADRVLFCTAFKLQTPAYRDMDTNGIAGDAAVSFWKDAVEYAHKLWRWELCRLTGSAEGLSDRELMREWMRRQSIKTRFRGWASLLRRCGWVRSWRSWPRWARLGAGGSPRYWIYAAAADLFLGLTHGFAPAGTSKQMNCEELQSSLPLIDRELYHLPLDWLNLCVQVTANYHRFVTTTRA